MKKIGLFLLMVIVALLINNNVVAEEINYNKKSFVFGDEVWFNIGDCIIDCSDNERDELIFDKNGYFFPHIIKLLHLKLFYQGRYIFEKKGLAYILYERDILVRQVTRTIPQQSIIILNW